MKHGTLFLFLLILSGGFSPAEAGYSFTVGTDDFYLSVGDYDYLPYAYAAEPAYVPPQISFYEVLSDYGMWTYVQPFGRAWVPYAAYGWRPYTYGSWIWTSYGWYWQGYEPWAWVAYHYGNWIWAAPMGWVWIPGYEWHPGRVAWAQGYGTLGWMPVPPAGYDYSRGYIAYTGEYNQFNYYDEDFDYDDYEDYHYGGPYYDPRYRNLYYNQQYQQMGFNLWVFIDNNHFGYDNYSDYYLDQDYTRYVFDRRMVRIDSRSVDRGAIERVTKHKAVEVPVLEREIQAEGRKLRMIVPTGNEEEKVRKNANRVVKDVIAPAFAEKQKTFKGEKSKNKSAINKIFRQENKPPRVETITSDVVIRKAEEAKKTREARRVQTVQTKKKEVEEIEIEGRVKPARKEAEASAKTAKEPKEPKEPKATREQQAPSKRVQETPQKPKEAREPYEKPGKDPDTPSKTVEEQAPYLPKEKPAKQPKQERPEWVKEPNEEETEVNKRKPKKKSEVAETEEEKTEESAEEETEESSKQSNKKKSEQKKKSNKKVPPEEKRMPEDQPQEPPKR